MARGNRAGPKRSRDALFVWNGLQIIGLTLGRPGVGFSRSPAWLAWAPIEIEPPAGVLEREQISCLNFPSRKNNLLKGERIRLFQHYLIAGTEVVGAILAMVVQLTALLCPLGHERNHMQLRGRRFVPTGLAFYLWWQACRPRAGLNTTPTAPSQSPSLIARAQKQAGKLQASRQSQGGKPRPRNQSSTYIVGLRSRRVNQYCQPIVTSSASVTQSPHFSGKPATVRVILNCLPLFRAYEFHRFR
jgi:hypothetical protein